MNWEANSAAFQAAPVGAHAATLIRIIDIGTQEGEYQGQKTVRRQNLFTWELPNEAMEDGQPFIISKFYTASIGEKANLTKDLTSWLGKAPQPGNPKAEDLLGKSCQVIVSERENTGKRVVSGLAPLPKGITIPKKSHNPIVFFDLENFDQTTFDGLSEGIKTMVMKSPEYANIINGVEPTVTAVEEDEPPF